MKERTPARLNPSITGLIVGLIVIIMGAVSLATFMSGMEQALPQNNGTMENRFDVYANKTGEIVRETENIKEAANIKQRTGALDVIGSIFSSGYSALLISMKSFDLFDTMMSDATEDVPFLALYKNLILAAFIVMLILGVVVAAMLKFNT